jgi:amino acid transporter
LEPPDVPYPPAAVAGAVVATLVAPCISLIVALVMRASERSPRRRSQLDVWVACSAGVFVLALIIWLAVVGAIGGSGSSGACRGGVDRLSPPSYEQTSDGWIKVMSCVDGGSKRVDVPQGQWPNK